MSKEAEALEAALIDQGRDATELHVLGSIDPNKVIQKLAERGYIIVFDDSARVS